jgi:hypothetical protein
MTDNGTTTASMNYGTVYVSGALSVGVTTQPSTVGLIRAANDVIAYFGSDERLKTNITRLENSLDKISKISGYEFDWVPMKGIHENEGHDIGVIAQEIEKILPEIVTTRENGFKAVKYERIVVLLIEGMKELKKEIDQIKEKLNDNK